MSENINPDDTQSVEHNISAAEMSPADETTEVVSNIVVGAKDPDPNLSSTEDEPAIVDDEKLPNDAETFPRSYVEKLRKEAAGHRDRAKRADDLAARLHTTLVEATGRLADARDLPFNESHLDDPVALSEAIDAVLADKPHLATRKPMGNIGQGVTPANDEVSLGGILRAGAM